MGDKTQGLPSDRANLPGPTLKRQLKLGGAVLMGLGSIIGTGVFVSIGIAAGVTGPSVVLAIALASLVAACNALSSAQLAASLPVSGGTYEYGYHYLRPILGFSAGWMFLCAKTASAATAALGFSGYLLCNTPFTGREWQIGIALAAVVILTVVVLQGIHRSNRVNQMIVSLTVFALLIFVAAGIPDALQSAPQHLAAILPTNFGSFFEATALMFVAYTGYGRIATLGEEVQSPKRTIPLAIIITLVTSALIYMSVALVSIASVGADAMAAATQDRAAPLEVIARQFNLPGVGLFVGVGAITAMLGVLLNLMLGLSRVLLAMGRRGDMPAIVTRLNRARTTPYVSVIVIGSAIGLLTISGDIKLTWSFSAFTVLVYYAVTNLAALALPKADRLYPRWISWVGLASCLFLAFWVQWQVWLAGLGILAIGLAWRSCFRQFKRSVIEEDVPQ
jgi:APA family basic amino acid/polyamine antiporter